MTASHGGAPARVLPEATLGRLTQYLRTLDGLLADGKATVSSDVLADASGVNSAILRKDLSQLGSYGTRGVGYDVQLLAGRIAETLGLTRDWRVAIVGMGNLGRALSGYRGFRSRGFTVAALIDANPRLVGQRIGDLVVSDVATLEKTVQAGGVNMAVLAVPGSAAQELTDRLVAAGVANILSFAPVLLQVPAHVRLRRVDMASELQILAYHAQQNG